MSKLENYHFATHTLTNESGKDHQGAKELEIHRDPKHHSTDDSV